MPCHCHSVAMPALLPYSADLSPHKLKCTLNWPKTKKEMNRKRFISFFSLLTHLLFRLLDETLFDTCFLTCEATQIIKFCTTHLTELVHCDRLDER